MTDSFDAWERESWESRADVYASGVVAMTVGAVDALLDATIGSRDHGETHLIDIGSGPGVVASAAVARGCSVVGVDVATAMVTLARSRVPAAEFRIGSALDLPAADGEFDAACGNFVLPHLSEPDRGIAEAARVVRSGGRVAFTEWDPVHHHAMRVFWDLIASNGMPMPGDAPERVGRALTDVASLRDALTGCGLLDVDVFEHRWSITVDPDDWWAAVLAATPRTGASISAVPADQRGELRQRYGEALAHFERTAMGVVLPCAAFVAVGTRG